MNKYFMVVVLLLLQLNAFAQDESYVVGGFKAGLGINQLNGLGNYSKSHRLTYDNNVLPKGEIGAVVQAMFSNKIMVQGEMNIALQSLELNEWSNAYKGTIERTNAIGSLDFVVYCGTKYPISKSFRLVGGVGPYFGLNLNRALSNVDTDMVWEIVNGMVTDNMQSMNRQSPPPKGSTEYHYFYPHKYTQAGIALMGGFESNSWQFTFNYGHGLTNLLYVATPIRNRSYQLSIVKFID